jgi:hypothetical protein
MPSMAPDEAPDTEHRGRQAYSSSQTVCEPSSKPRVHAVRCVDRLGGDPRAQRLAGAEGSQQWRSWLSHDHDVPRALLSTRGQGQHGDRARAARHARVRRPPESGANRAALARWDLAGYRITVRESKTDAGIRQIDILPTLHDEMSAHKAQAPDTAPLTPSCSPPPRAPSWRRATSAAACSIRPSSEPTRSSPKQDDVPLPDGLTPHKLRHTFASILVAPSIPAASWTSSGTPTQDSPRASTATE